MKLTITTEDSVQVLAALYEKARRIEEDTGEAPRKLMLAAKKIRRQIQTNLKKKKDEDKRRRKTEDKRPPCRDKAVAAGEPANPLLGNPITEELIRESNILNVRLKMLGT